MNYKLYMFDFDLTMADTVDASATSYADAYSTLGLNFDKKETFRHLGMPIEVTFGEITDGVTDDGRYQKFLDAFYLSVKENFHSVTLYPDVPAAFERIKNGGAYVAVVTNRTKPTMRTVYDKYPELERVVATTVTGDDVERRKPFPDPLIVCMQRLGVPPDQAIYFGDAKNDFLSAEAAGVKFVYVDRTGYVNEKDAIKNFDDIE